MVSTSQTGNPQKEGAVKLWTDLGLGFIYGRDNLDNPDRKTCVVDMIFLDENEPLGSDLFLTLNRYLQSLPSLNGTTLKFISYNSADVAIKVKKAKKLKTAFFYLQTMFGESITESSHLNPQYLSASKSADIFSQLGKIIIDFIRELDNLLKWHYTIDRKSYNSVRYRS